MLGIVVGTVNRILSDNWDEIVARVPPDLLPRERGPRQSRYKHTIDEYGCGSYGCVAATGRSDVVVKITTDPTEVRFIEAAIRLDDWPEGIVRYYDIMTLRGGYRGRPAYMIWREEARNVGAWYADTWGGNPKYWDNPPDPDPEHVRARAYLVRCLRQFDKRLKQFKFFANIVRKAALSGVTFEAAMEHEQWAWDKVALEDVDNMHIPSRMRANLRMAWALRALKIVVEMMGSEPEGYYVGGALDFYLKRKIVLADVHANNIGEVIREDYTKPLLVITDPGHAVML